ncbi:MAG: T9SS type A sorting domain-containing protein, partial [Bacteroidales bacterium]
VTDDGIVTGVSAGTASFTYTDGTTNCSNTTEEVTVNALPTVSITGPTSICVGSTTTLSPTSGGSWTSSDELVATVTDDGIVTGVSAGTASFTYTDGTTNCSNTTEEVTVNALPTVDAGTDASIPNGTSTTLDATVTGDGPFTYSWEPASLLVDATVEDPTTVNLSTTTTFTLTATSDATGCSASDDVTITITGSALSASASATPSTVCAGENVQLSVTASGGSGTYTYTWTSSPAGFSSTESDPVANPSETTTYYVEVDDGFNTVNDQVTVTVNALPAVDAGADASIPNGTSTTLDATVTGDGSFTYSWEPASLLDDATVEDPTTVNLSTTTTFTLTATSDATGCSASDDVKITITGSVLSASASATPSSVCPGESVQLSASASGGSGTYTYTWTSDPEGFNSTESDPVATPTETTTYYVEVDDGYNTVNSEVTVTYNDLPTVSITGPTYIAVGFTTTLSPSTGGTWISSDPAIATVTDDGVVTGVSAGTASFTYTDNITGCSNTTEEITVRSLPAGWDVNPPDYIYNGEVTAKVLIEEIAVESGVLAAFAGEECRGLVDASYYEPSDHYVFVLICYDNNSPGARLTFKYYDVAKDTVYDMDRTVDFMSDMIVGSAVDPLIMSVGVDYKKSFPVGWSWFSVNIFMDDMTLGNVLPPDPAENDYIKNQVASATYYEGYGWFGELEEIDPTELYKVKIQNISDIDITGWAVDVAETPIELVTGWNWIGYLPQVSIPIDEALSSVSWVDNDYIKNQTASSTYYEDYGWFGDQLPELVPTDGYMMKVANPATLIYPASSSGKKSIHIPDETEDYRFNPGEFEFNGSITARVLIDSLPAGSADDKLLAYVDNEIRGVIKGQYFEPTGEYLFPIMVHSNLAEGETIEFRYYDALNDKIYDCEGTLTFKKDMIVADAYESFDLNAKTGKINDFPDSDLEPFLKVYPNPFEGVLNIEYNVPEIAHISLTVFDIFGKPVNVLVDQEQPAGNYLIQWDSQAYHSGMYIIQYTVGNVRVIRKVHLIR